MVLRWEDWILPTIQPATSEECEFQFVQFFILLLLNISRYGLSLVSYNSLSWSSLCRFVDFCYECSISNFGLPVHFYADVLALPAVSSLDLPAIYENVMSRTPDIKSFDFGSFDLTSPLHNAFSLAQAFHAFLRFIPFSISSQSFRSFFSLSSIFGLVLRLINFLLMALITALHNGSCLFLTLVF